MDLDEAAYAARVAVLLGRTFPPPAAESSWWAFLGLPCRYRAGPPSVL